MATKPQKFHFKLR